MSPLGPGQLLQWSSSGPKSFSLLNPEGEVCAKLTFETRDGSLATGKTVDGEWTFKRVGFFNPAITVRSPGAETDIALFQQNRVGFGGGRTFVWKQVERPGPKMAFADREGHLVILQYARFTRRLCEADVQIASPISVDAATASILVLLAWHIALLRHKDEELASLAAVVMMIS